ncbi:MAG: hypothetical protein M1830_002854 [Pleopsidium flavum]|nr:MAG: hypothetical protein M1830_002854 [Pleopsidium flavum]
MDTEFSFDRLSDDGKVAIFRGERVPDDLQKLQRGCLRDALEGNNVEKPAHYVQFRRQIHDTEIPGIQLDLQALELTCDWRGMYSAFFAEEKLCGKLIETWVGKQESWAKEVRAKAESGVDTSDSMLEMIKNFGNQSEDDYRDARRARIRRQYLEKHNWDWDPTDLDMVQEKTILKRLRDKRFAAGMEEYSDDDDEADEDQIDEDVWEDEDDGDGSEEEGENEEDEEDEDEAEDEEGLNNSQVD